MPELWAVLGILVVWLGSLVAAWLARGSKAKSDIEVLQLRLEIHQKAASQLQHEFAEFQKGVSRYVESRDERDRIRAIGDLGTRIERVLQLFPDGDAPQQPDDTTTSQTPPEGDDKGVDTPQSLG